MTMVNVTNRQLHILVCPLAQVYKNKTSNEVPNHQLSPFHIKASRGWCHLLNQADHTAAQFVTRTLGIDCER
jgi:hypothetical protein